MIEQGPGEPGPKPPAGDAPPGAGPPPAGPPRYGTGPWPVAAPAAANGPGASQPSPWTRPNGPWAQPWREPHAEVGPVPSGPAPCEWMELDPERPARWGIPDVLLAFLAFFVGGTLGGAVGVAGTVILAALSGEPATQVMRDSVGVVNIAGLVGSWAATVGFLVLISRVKGQGSLRRDFGFAFSWWDPLIGFVAAFVTLVVSAPVQSLIAWATGSEPASNSDAVFGDVADSPVLTLVMVLMASIGAPIVEELLFRGLALRAFEKRAGVVAGVAGSSILFGLTHLLAPDISGPAALAGGLAVYGVVFALFTRRWRRIGPAVFAHLWLNGLASAYVLVEVLGRQ